MLQRLIPLLLAPVLLRQAKTLRRTMPRLPEPEGARLGMVGHGPKLRLLVAGDSAAAGVGAAHQSEALTGQLVSHLSEHFEVQWQLSARSGLTTSQIAERLAAETVTPFDVAVVSTGVNDVLSQLKPADWPGLLEGLAEVLRRHCSVRHIVFAPLPPMHQFPALPQPLRWFLGQRAKAFNRQLATFAQGRADCRVLDLPLDFKPEMMASDGFHPGVPAYALWAEAVALETMRWVQMQKTPVAGARTTL